MLRTIIAGLVILCLTTASVVTAEEPVGIKAPKGGETIQYGSDADSGAQDTGEYGEVSTIMGNGAATQGAHTADHPRHPDLDSKGRIYFVDGSQKTAKVRMWDGTKNTTVVDLLTNKVTRREGSMFWSTGLAVIKDTVYVASNTDVYKVTAKDRVTQLDTDIKRYMKNGKYEFIYRMEKFRGNLYLMLRSKNGMYGFAMYDLSTKKMSEVLPQTLFPGNPQNFYIDDQRILVSCSGGYIYSERFNPRKSVTVADTNIGGFTDAWYDSDKTLYAVLIKDRVYAQIIAVPASAQELGDEEILAGARRGFQDGVADEAEMDYPTDFIWDGTGFIFADRDNNALRKLWIDTPPTNAVK